MMESLLEERRRGLQNWLKILCCHPVMSQSAVVRVFLTDNTIEYQEHLRVAYQTELDEFTRLSADFELPLEDQGRLAVSRESMRRMLNAISKLKRLVDHQVQRTQAQGKDMEELSSILRQTNNTPDIFPTNTFLRHMTEGTHNVSTAAERFAVMQQKSIGERLVILLEVLHGHSDLCDRVERGIVAEHQKALSKMLNLNRQKIKGVIRGTAADNVNAMHEKEVQQTGVVGKLGRRSAFSLYCILNETSLVQQYLQSVPSILLSFCHEQQLGNSELAKCWSKIVDEETQQLNK